MSTRQIKDAVNHSTGELVYFKGHAKATFMSDGKTVEEAINNIEIPTVPTKVSELENDSKFITIDEVPEVTVPTKTSELTNDSGFITINDVPVLEIPEEYVTETELNDKGFLTEHQDISHLASRNWVESQGYAHQEDLLEISFNDIQDSPISIDDSGMINFVDESGNVGFQINEEGLRVTEVIAGEHKLSEKANASDIPSLVGYAKTEDIPSLNGYATEEWVNNKNYATEYDLKTIDYSSINNIPTLEDETGELNIADESGNIGMKIASEAVYAKDFVAGEHKLSEKADKTYVDSIIATKDELNAKQDALISGTNIKTINGESILGSGNIEVGGGGNSVVMLSGDIPSVTLSINTTYIGTSSLVSLRVNGIEDFDGRYGECTIAFRSYLTGTTLTLPDEFLWANGTKPEIDGDTEYELSISVRKNIYSFPYYKAVLTPFKPVE